MAVGDGETGLVATGPGEPLGPYEGCARAQCWEELAQNILEGVRTVRAQWGRWESFSETGVGAETITESIGTV